MSDLRFTIPKEKDINLALTDAARQAAISSWELGHQAGTFAGQALLNETVNRMNRDHQKLIDTNAILTAEIERLNQVIEDMKRTARNRSRKGR